MMGCMWRCGVVGIYAMFTFVLGLIIGFRAKKKQGDEK